MRLVSKENLRTLATHGLGAALPAPKKRRNLESEMQRALIVWWREACKGFGVPEQLLFSIPNGGGGGKLRGHWLKLEGLRAGVPDLMLAVANPSRWPPFVNPHVRYNGLFLELKTATGSPSTDQEIYHGVLRASGYRVEVVRTLEDAKTAITDYLK